MKYDAVVIGAGPNGLAAANHLADAGWSVLVVEEQDTVGGAVRSDRELHPDYIHDTFSAFYPLAAASPALRGLGLEQHGLTWRRAPAPLAHPFPDGSWVTVHPDREVTAARMDEQCAGDGEAWLRLCSQWDGISEAFLTSLLTPFPPVRGAARMLWQLPRVGGLDFVKTLLSPVTDLADARFRGRSPGILLAGNAAHADIPLDAPGSGLMGLLMTMLAQTVGFPVPQGGAGQLTQAMARRLQSLGGEIVTGDRVDRIEVARGRAHAVRTSGGQRFEARRGVLADVVAPTLYETLLDPADVPGRILHQLNTFRLDPGTVKVDWALSSLVPWQSPPPEPAGTVHVSDSRAQLTEALQQVHAGHLPAEPFLLCGQMTTADPDRSPAGTESMWAYTHVPQRQTQDAGDGGITGEWGPDDKERFADRMQTRIEKLAPGFGDRIVARRVLGPHDLQARDANLLGGAINGGTAQLSQQLIFRPVPGLGRAETPIRGLYLSSASAHPGGGVHGAAGFNAARAAIAHDRVRSGFGLRRMTGRVDGR